MTSDYPICTGSQLQSDPDVCGIGVRISIYVQVLFIQLLLFVTEPFFLSINTACLTVSALCVTAYIQYARDQISDYHLATAHNTAIIMVPAILSLVAKVFWVREQTPFAERKDKMPPITTTVVATVCFALNMGLLGIEASKDMQKCSFDGVYKFDWAHLPHEILAAIGIYFLGLAIYFPHVCGIYPLPPIFVRLIGIICQSASVVGTCGLIDFIETGVQNAQPYLQGGNEDNWGFGQILAFLLLVLPAMDQLNYMFSGSKIDPSKTKCKMWWLTTGKPFWERINRAMRSRRQRNRGRFDLDRGESSVNLSAVERGQSFNTEGDIEMMSRTTTHTYKDGAVVTFAQSI